jgi:ribose transport system substrate-binding protein
MLSAARTRLRSPSRALAAAALVVVAMAGCSKVESDTGAAAPEVETSTLDAGYAGDFEPPPSEGPAAQQGKNVWYISCGQAYVACANSATWFQEAGQALGWDVTVIDGKADPSTAANAIKQGVAAGVDGIALFTFDCPGIKSSLLEARAADIPVVNFGSLDCDDPGFGEGEPLFAASLNVRGSDNPADYWSDWGKWRAQYAVAALGGEPGGIINIHETSQRGHQYQQEGFEATVKELCREDCELIDTPFTFAQVPTRSSEIFKAAIARNPDAKVVCFEPDALMGLGLGTVFEQSGRSLVRVGGEALPPNLEAIRQGKQDQSTFIPYNWYMWGLADTLNRIFAGEADNLPSQGGGFMYVDKDHNLPTGDEVELPIDFRAAYQELWGAGA